MQKDRKQSPATSDGGAAFHGNIIDLIPIAKAHSDRASGFALIDQAAEALQASEQRASHAEEKAHKISSKAIEAVRALGTHLRQLEDGTGPTAADETLDWERAARVLPRLRQLLGAGQ